MYFLSPTDALPTQSGQKLRQNDFSLSPAEIGNMAKAEAKQRRKALA